MLQQREQPVFLVDMNELDGDLVPVAMNYTLNYGPGIRLSPLRRPHVGQWVLIYSDNDDVYYWAETVADLSERRLSVRVDWGSCERRPAPGLAWSGVTAEAWTSNTAPTQAHALA